MVRSILCAFLGLGLLLASGYAEQADPAASKLARRAEQARKSGQIVRAYLLYAEAAARAPQNPTYIANRDALAPAAKLLTKANVQNADVSAEVKAAEAQNESGPPPIEIASRDKWEHELNLAPMPKLELDTKLASFNARGDERTLFEEVGAVYGIRVTFDPQLVSKPDLHFEIEDADFGTAMEGLTALTGTFLFPISPKQIVVAADTEAKRNELEPEVLLTFPLPNALEQRDLIEAANAVRSVLTARAMGWDSSNRTVLIRDRASRARIARSLLESVLLPKAQVSFEVQFLAIDSRVNYHYGLALPTSFPVVSFGTLHGFQSILPMFSTAMNFATFGGGSTLFGIGLTDATLFATYSKTSSQVLYDATVAVSDGQTANFHVGEQYPIAQALSTYSAQNPSIYNPIGQVQMVDLGIILKLRPRVSGDGTIAIDMEAENKGLGSQTFNTVPAIAQRTFKSTVNVREGEWAVLAGLDADSRNVTRNGLIGLSQIPGLNQVVSENTRDTESSKTLIVIKPTLTRLPGSAGISPQYLAGPVRGPRVLL